MNSDDFRNSPRPNIASAGEVTELLPHSPTAKSIFLEAVDLGHTPEERSRHARQACGDDQALFAEVQGLLRGHQLTNALVDNPEAARPLFAEAEDESGQMIGPYRLLNRIGEGGMGVVYRARQDAPVAREVAVKIIKPGMDTEQVLARFEAERQTLALMEHPNIARVLDAGTTGETAEEETEREPRSRLPHSVLTASRPYFVMELVNGLPLTEFCDEECLSLSERLRLFLELCHAVQHAHQKGVIHRDLKPGNVLVARREGGFTVKVIDFGIARALEDTGVDLTRMTRPDQLIGTPLYISPEQVNGSSRTVDTRTDVYSLGILLYELVTSGLPIDRGLLESAGVDEFRRLIREVQPRRPSAHLSTLNLETQSTIAASRGTSPGQLVRTVRGELDGIILKAMQKEPERRYQTVDALAADLQRFLDGDAVEACPPSMLYQMRKFAGRHRVLLTTSAIVMLAVVTGTAIAIQQAIRARRAEDRLDGLLQEAHSNAAELQQLLYATDIRLAGRAWADGDIHQAHLLLERHRPDPNGKDLRGLEWHLLNNLIQTEGVVLTDHVGSFYLVTLAPDGRWLASAGEDGTVQVYTTDDLRPMLVIETGQGEVNGLAFHPDGGELVSAGDDGTLRCWDLSTGAERWRINAHPNLAFQVAYTADAAQLVSCGNEQYARLWDADSGDLLHTIGPHDRRVDAVTMTKDGKTVLTASGNQLCIWSGPGHRHKREHDIPVRATSIALSAREELILVGSLENRTYVIPFNGNWSGSTSAHNDGVQAVAFSPDGNWAASGDRGGVLTLWRSPTPSAELRASGEIEAARRWQAHAGRIWSIDFAADGSRLATAGEDGVVRVWPLEEKDTPRTLELHRPDYHHGVTRGFELRANGSLVAVGDFRLTKFDPLAGAPRALLHAGGGHHFLSLAVASQSDLIIAGTQRGTVRFWDGRTHRELPEWNDEAAGELLWLGLTPDGTRLIARAQHKTIALTVPELQPITELELRRCDGIDLSPDGRWLAYSPKEVDAMELWDLDQTRLVKAFPRHDAAISTVRFSNDRRLLAAGDGRRIKLYEVDSARLLGELVGHRGNVTSTCFSRDGRSLLSTGWDRTVRIWSVDTLQELLVLGEADTVEFGEYQVGVGPAGTIVQRSRVISNSRAL